MILKKTPSIGNYSGSHFILEDKTFIEMEANNTDEIKRLRQEIDELKEQIYQKEEAIRTLTTKHSSNQIPYRPEKLSNDDIFRYSRQIILPDVGISGQIKLRNAKVLVVGAGGLGCPALLYLVSAGVENIGIIDYDVVELNNLHRQTLHDEISIGKPKVISAKEALLKINRKCNIEVINEQFMSHSSEHPLDVVERYDVILDCTDNVATRYLLNDACVLRQKPLVSGSALKFEGQLTVYNYDNGPCYRCIFPTPPPPESVSNCGDAGVLGAVTGVIGSLQALEAIKIIINKGNTLKGRLLIFDGLEGTMKTVKLRPKRENCVLCSDQAVITNLVDYEIFCGMSATDKNIPLAFLPDESRLQAAEFFTLRENRVPFVLIDVRSTNEFEICSLEDSLNIPLKNLLEEESLGYIKDKAKVSGQVIVVCRRGNDSQIAVDYLQGKLDNAIEIRDIIGGLTAWHNECDETFPIY